MPTSLKLPPQLQTRVKAAAKSAGKSPHAFMVEAIERQTELAERRKQFVSDALAAEKDTGASGYLASDVHAAMQARALGHKAKPLKQRTWRR